MTGPSAGTAGLRSAERIGETLHLVLNGVLDAVEAGRLELLAYFAPHALSPRTINRLEVIFEELVSNAVRHGFQGRPGHSLHVWADMAAQGPRLSFEDDGPPFDPLTAPVPAPFTGLEEAKVGGLGVALVRRLSSSLRYDHAASRDAWSPGHVNRTTVTLAAG